MHLEMGKRQIAPKSILGTIEVFAVIGIFSLYALEFSGISTFSALVPIESQEKFSLIGFDLGGVEIELNQGVAQIMGFVFAFVFIYFLFIRDMIKKKFKMK